MARLNRAAIPDDDSDIELYVDHSCPQAQSSSSPPTSSDKENNTQEEDMPVSTRSKGKARASTASVQTQEARTSTPAVTAAGTARSTTSRIASTVTTPASRRSKAPLEPQMQQGNDADVPDTEGPDGEPSGEVGMMYDPQQDHEERKEIRRTYRDLHRKVTGKNT